MRSRASILALLATALGAVAVDAADATADSRTILFIWEQAPEADYVRQINEGFREGLAHAQQPPTLFIEYQDVLRFGDRTAHRTEFLQWLHRKYQDRRIDIIAVTAQDTLQLVAQRPPDFWPGTPLTYGTLGHLTVDIRQTHPEVSGLVLENYFPEALRVIRELLPDTRRIAVIQGASEVERARARWWISQVREQQLEVMDLTGLAIGDLLARLRNLPEGTVGFYFGIQIDADGRTFGAGEAAQMVADAANRPMFSLDGADVKLGMVGGPMPDWRVTGREYARHVLGRLDGLPPRTEILPASQYTSLSFNAQQLARWRIPEERLPAGSSLVFREPSLWRDYRGTVIAAISVGLIQSLLIVAVLIERRNRARARAALGTSYAQLRDLTKQLITAQEEERTRIARDLHDDIGQRLASLSIALSRLKRNAPEAQTPVREELGALQQQAASLSSDLRHLSHDLHSGVLEHLGLVDALRARCEEFANENGVVARLTVSDNWRKLPQQMELCLYRVAQEALRNVARHAKARQVLARLDRTDDKAVMQIMDDGVGFEHGTGTPRSALGLVSLRERVRMLGGQLEIRSAPSAGTTLIVTLPCGEADAA